MENEAVLGCARTYRAGSLLGRTRVIPEGDAALMLWVPMYDHSSVVMIGPADRDHKQHVCRQVHVV